MSRPAYEVWQEFGESMRAFLRSVQLSTAGMRLRVALMRSTDAWERACAESQARSLARRKKRSRRRRGF